MIDSSDLFAHYQSLFDEFMNDNEGELETWEDEIQDSIETWFNGIQGRLTEEVAVDLQNQIDSLRNFYVEDHVLYLPNTEAVVSDGVLILGTT